MINANRRRLYDIATAILLAQAMSLWLQRLWAAWRTPLAFDDAYMFARYATNIRHGLGFSWNLDGTHTYGPTSLLWQFVVLLMSFLPLSTWKMLTLSSWLCSIGVVLAISWAVARNARSEIFSSVWRVLPLVAVPLTGVATFTSNQTTGMETMLAAMLCAVFVGCALQWARGAMRPEITGLVGVLLFLTRPESGMVVVLVPLLLCCLRFDSGGWKGLARVLGVFFGGVVVDFAVCRAYFHTIVPLSFYMKSGHGYEGVRGTVHPELLLLVFLAGCELYLVTSVFLVRKVDGPLIVSFLVPAGATFVYLCTVDQIMGYNSRFYLPYLALIVVPSLLVLDRWIAEGRTNLKDGWPGHTLLIRSGGAALLMLGFLVLSSQYVLGKIRHAERFRYFVYDAADVRVTATVPLPQKEWDTEINAVTNLLVAPFREEQLWPQPRLATSEATRRRLTSSIWRA